MIKVENDMNWEKDTNHKSIINWRLSKIVDDPKLKINWVEGDPKCKMTPNEIWLKLEDEPKWKVTMMFDAAVQNIWNFEN